MQIEKTPIRDLLVLTPKRFGDARGFFSETYNAGVMSGLGIDTVFVQDNHSLSEAAGTLRGLHFQAPPHAQTKLVRCGRGALFDVAVDIRKGSPTFGQWYGAELSFENARQMLIPAGFAHGFVTRAPATEVVYKCSDTYAPQAEGAIIWNDPDLAIDWGLTGDPILSDKDRQAPRLAELDSPFEYEGDA